mgnify:CR=1 FL=1
MRVMILFLIMWLLLIIKKEQVLSDVSFTAKQGEVTALIGPSGGGKTTISRLAARFYDIDSGKIIVGGMDISKINPEKLLELYSIVFQDVTLFNNTIMENIRIGKKDATDQEVMAAAKLAHCDEFVENMPDQWNTMIGEMVLNYQEDKDKEFQLRELFKRCSNYLNG